MHYLIQIFFYSFIFVFASVSCNKFMPDQKDLVARVGSNYLYKDDLVKLLGNPLDYSDSLVKTRKLIDNWARNQLLIQQAKINLPEGDLQELEFLIDNIFVKDEISTSVLLSREAVLASSRRISRFFGF